MLAIGVSRNRSGAPGRPCSHARVGPGPRAVRRPPAGPAADANRRCLLLQQHQFASAHIGTGEPPAQGLLALCRFDHQCCKPVVAAGAEHALFQHGARCQHAGDVAFEQGALGAAFGGCRFQLVAESHTAAFANQFSAVALGGVMRDARHRHPADGFAALFAGERQLQQPGQFNRIFEEAFEEIAQAIKQHPFGMARLELHVVAQHRCELCRVHQAVVGPGRFIALAGGWAASSGCVAAVRPALAWLGSCALPRPGAGVIGAEFVVAECRGCGLRVRCWADGAAVSGAPNRLPCRAVRQGHGRGPGHRLIVTAPDRLHHKL